MKPEEKNALLQFMGQIYGETKKHDQMVVGQSTNLQPKSEEVKREFEKVLRSTPTEPSQYGQPQNVAVPAQQNILAETTQLVPEQNNVVTPEQAAAELAQQGISKSLVPNVDRSGLEEVNIQTQVVDPNQMEFDLTEPSKVDKIIELLECQNKLLVEIRDSSIKSKYNAKRAKNKKPQ